MSVRARLKEERGQSVILFFFIMSGLFALMALLVNVGALFQVGHQLQATVDSAALAGAQEEVSTSRDVRIDLFPGQTAADLLRKENMPDSAFSGSGYAWPRYRDGTTSADWGKPAVGVNLSKDFSFYFTKFFDAIGMGALTNVTLHASSVASTEAPVSLDQIAPLALECDFTCMSRSGPTNGARAWPLSPETGSTVTFHFTKGALQGQPRLALIRLLPGSDPSQLNCAPQGDTSSCDPTVISSDQMNVPQLVEPLSLEGDLANAAGADIRVVPVVTFNDAGDNDPDNDTFNIVGWAAVSWTAPTSGGPPGALVSFDVDITFHKLFVGSKWMSDSGIKNNEHDFGVNAIGLTGCQSAPNACDP